MLASEADPCPPGDAPEHVRAAFREGVRAFHAGRRSDPTVAVDGAPMRLAAVAQLLHDDHGRLPLAERRLLEDLDLPDCDGEPFSYAYAAWLIEAALRRY